MAFPVTVSTHLKAPVDVAFAAFTNWERLSRVMFEALFFEFESEHHEGAGVKWRMITGDAQTPTSAIHEILEFQAPNRFVMTSDDPSSLETMAFDFRAVNGGTEVVFVMSPQPKGCLFMALAPLMRGAMRKAMADDLQRRAHEVEEEHMRAMGL
ncbi:MAG: hypothetical protein Fur0036_06570 [Fimbriimonadaceae bacterium]